MNVIGFVFSALLFLNAIAAPSVWAETDWQVLQTLKLDTKPMDILMAADNRWIYILDDQGRVLIYGTNGRLKDTIAVGRGVDEIKAGPRDDLLFLLNRNAGTIQLASVNVREAIDTQYAPIKGPVDAPVTIAVFSDFQ